jgi:GT2 family glycosyltransferase
MEPSSSYITRSPAARATIEPCDDPSVSVLIVTFGTGPIVVDAIGRIAEHSTGTRIEVIVVDNPHPDVPRRSRHELALSTSGVRVLVPSRNLGFGGGCELAVLHARADVLAFVNPDLLVGPGWLAPMLDRLRDGAGIVAPVLVGADRSIDEVGMRLHDDGSTSRITDPGERADFASAACWLVRRDVHEELGGFDPGFHPAYYEDVDLALRAADAARGIEIVPVHIEHRRGTGAHGPVGEVFETWRQRDLLLERHPEIRWTRPRRTSPR